jgi:hypothetical protein
MVIENDRGAGFAHVNRETLPAVPKCQRGPRDICRNGGRNGRNISPLPMFQKVAHELGFLSHETTIHARHSRVEPLPVSLGQNVAAAGRSQKTFFSSRLWRSRRFNR